MRGLNALQILEALSYIAVIVGIPMAVANFMLSTRKEERAREYGTYDALDQKFLDFQRLCLDHPELDIFDIEDKSIFARSTGIDDQRLKEKREIVAFTILFSTFERAYLMYLDKSETVRANQYEGWAEYMDSYCRRENFRRAWALSGETFDSRFQAEMEKRIKNAVASSGQTL